MTQKNIIAVLGVAVVILIGTAIYFTTINKASQSVTPAPKVAQQPVPTPAPTAQPALATQPNTPASVPADWITYTSKTFNASISLPSDWKLVWPNDGSLNETHSDIFNGDIKFGFLTTVSSPDEKEGITFINGPLDIGTHTCTAKLSEINGQKVRETTCTDTVADQGPGRNNYEFIDKNLVLIIDNKTAITDKVISLIKFN